MTTAQIEAWIAKSTVARERLTLLRAQDTEAFRAWLATTGQPMEVFRLAEYRYDVLNGFKNALRDQLYNM